VRVLIACSFALPTFGGVWTYVTWLEKGLKRAGHDVEILALHPNLQQYHLIRSGESVSTSSVKTLLHPKIHGFVRRYTHEQNERTFVQSMELHRYCLEVAALYFGLDQYDVIHTQDVIAALALSRAKSTRTALLATVHSSLSGEWALGQTGADQAAKLKYLRRIEQLGLAATACTITPSLWLKNRLMSEFNLSEHRCHVVPSGIDIEEFEGKFELDTDLKFPATVTNIVCPARLDKVKGHHDLLFALFKLKQLRTDWLCWLVGDGPMNPVLRKQSQDLGLTEHIVFVGERRDVPALLRQADVVVLASWQENLPFAVMEAQLAGKPVVVTDAGGIPEMVEHERTGLLSPVKDINALYENLKLIVEDVQLRDRLSRQAHRFATDAWSLRVMTERMEEMYRQFIPPYEGADFSPTVHDRDRDQRPNRVRTTGWNDYDDAGLARFRFVSGRDFDDLFLPDLPTVYFRVDRIVWERIRQNAPRGYRIPDESVLNCGG
jgi:glycosyltransferase involved in cell wall biosynthesis